jgi:hypothetical protein
MSNALSVNEWPLWELINPSDPYTFRAPDVRVAGMAAFIMSHAYGAKRVGGGECSPMILGWDEWAAEHGIDEQWIDSHAHELAEAFESFLIGPVEDREVIESIIREMQSASEIRKWKLERQDKLRSSFSAIGEAAYLAGDHFREVAKKLARKAGKAGSTACYGEGGL